MARWPDQFFGRMGKASCKASFVKRSAEASKPCPVRVIRIDFVMSADVRFSANSGPIDWQLPALCRVPLAVEGNLLGSWPGAGRGARALALRALRHRVAAEWRGWANSSGPARGDCSGSLWSRKRTRHLAD